MLQGDTLRSFLANVGQSPLSSAQAPIPAVSIGIVRVGTVTVTPEGDSEYSLELAMGVASDGRLMGTIEHHTRYPSYGSTEVLRGSHMCSIRAAEALAARQAEAQRIMPVSLGLTDLAGPIGRKS